MATKTKLTELNRSYSARSEKKVIMGYLKGGMV